MGFYGLTHKFPRLDKTAGSEFLGHRFLHKTIWFTPVQLHFQVSDRFSCMSKLHV